MKTWFYFYVKGAYAGQKCKFVIKNMNRQAKLYNMGLRPVYRVIPSNRGWARVPGNTTWGRGDHGLEIRWDFTFNLIDDQKVYFAFTYPFSYYDIQEQLNKIEDRLQDPQYDYIYFHREVLGHSIEKRNVDLITLSSKEGLLDEREDLIENCFPEHGDDKSKRPLKFSNK